MHIYIRKKEFKGLIDNFRNKEYLWRISNLLKGPNPYYLGFGNPDANILFIGKEKGFDEKNARLLFYESVCNFIQWEYIISYGKLLNHKYLFRNLGFNPMFPRMYPYSKLTPAGTWGKYSKIIGYIYNKDWKTLFYNTSNISKSMFNYCFMTELNHKPSKESHKLKFKCVNPIRKHLLSHEFYRSFPVIVIGARTYLQTHFKNCISPSLQSENKTKWVELTLLDIFGLFCKCRRIKGIRNQTFLCISDRGNLVIVTDQLSMWWEDSHLKYIASICKSHLKNLGLI